MKELTRRGLSKNSGSYQEQIRALEHELDAFRQSELNYRVLLEQAPAGILVARDNPLRLVYVNPAMAELTGRTTEELLAFDAGGDNQLGSRAGQGGILTVVSRPHARVDKPPTF